MEQGGLRVRLNDGAHTQVGKRSTSIETCFRNAFISFSPHSNEALTELDQHHEPTLVPFFPHCLPMCYPFSGPVGYFQTTIHGIECDPILLSQH